MRGSSDHRAAPFGAALSFGAIISQASVIALAALVPAGFSGFFHPKRPPYDGGAARVPEITLEAVAAWPEPPLWVDARKAGQYDAGHIPDAISLTIAGFDEQLGAFLDAWEPGRNVVVYCDSTDCGTSQEIAARLRDDAGIAQIHVLAGGYREWMRMRKQPGVP